jgi:hypothetical protein
MKKFPGLMKNVPLNGGDSMWFQHDSCHPHFTHQVHNWLNNHSLNAWKGHGFLIVWIPRSPDLNPLLFRYWDA